MLPVFEEFVLTIGSNVEAAGSDSICSSNIEDKWEENLFDLPERY